MRQSLIAETLLGPTTYKDTVYIATDLNISTIPIM